MKTKIWIVTFAITLILAFTACNNLISESDGETQNKKITYVSFTFSNRSVTKNVSRNADENGIDFGEQNDTSFLPENLTESGIQLIALYAYKWNDTLTAYEIYGGSAPYKEWTFTSEKTAIEVMEEDSIPFEYGKYKFALDIMASPFSEDEENELVTIQIAELETVDITSDTKSIAFDAKYQDTGFLKVQFKWSCDSVAEQKIGKIEAGLFTVESKGEEAFDNICVYKTVQPKFNAKTKTATAVYIPEIDGLPNPIKRGKYYLKYRYYDITETTVLNTALASVEIDGFRTQKEISINLDDVNNLPKSEGSIFVASKINITVTKDDNFYLNKGNVVVTAQTEDGKEVPREDISAKLFYGGNELDESFYYFDGWTFNIGVNGNDNLLGGGKYQLYIEVNTEIDGNTYTASETLDLTVEDLSYYEFEITNSEDPGELETELTETMKTLESPAYIRILGCPEANETPETGEPYAKGYFAAISNALKENAAYKVDLDLRDAWATGGSTIREMSEEDGFSNCSCLRSVALSPYVLKITEKSFNNLENLESILIEDNGYMYSVTPQRISRIIEGGAFYCCPSIKEFTIDASEGTSTVYSTTANGQVLLKDISIIENGSSRFRKAILAAAASLEELDLSDTDLFPDATDTNGSECIVEIMPYAFNNSKIKTITNFGEIKTLGANAFENCSQLTSVNFDGLKCIYKNAFTTYANVSSFNLSNSILAVQAGALPKYADIAKGSGTWYQVEGENAKSIIDGWIASKPTSAQILETSDATVTEMSGDAEYSVTRIMDSQNANTLTDPDNTWLYRFISE